MKFEISTDNPEWRHNAAIFMEKKKTFALTKWHSSQHRQDCTALTRQFDYTCIIDHHGGEALFSPKD